MKKIIILLPLLCLVFLRTGLAQGVINVRGTVVDENKEPLIGVTVAVLNEDDRVVDGSITDFDGRYFIKVGSNGRLQFSFIGMKSQTLDVKGRSVINITMQEQHSTIDEISVIAREKKSDGFMPIDSRDMATARENFDMAEVEGVGVTSLEEAMSGRLANVNIIANSGDPGSGTAIRIRGTASLNGNNEPLIVVDGIPFETNISDDFDFATANEEDFGSLVNIAPEDIKSIEVLKDAAATAIWGERGSNGVLVISSKRGRVGKTSINFSSKFSVREEPDPIPLLNRNQYYALQQDAMWNRMKDFVSEIAYENLEYEYNDLQDYLNPNFKYFDEFNAETDWTDLITRQSMTQDYNLSMSGGGDRARYYVSMGYLTDKGTTIGTGLDRFTSRINIDYNVSRKLVFSTDFSFATSTKDAPFSQDEWKSVRGLALIKNPGMSPYEIDEEGNMTDIYFTADNNNQNWQGSLTDYYNPVAAVNESSNEVLNSRIRSTFRVKYNFIEGFTYQGDVSFDLNNTQNKKFLPQVVTGIPWNKGNANKAVDGTTESFSVYIYNKLNFYKVFNEKHEVNGLLATTTRMSTSDAYSGAVSGLNSSQVTDPSAGGVIQELSSGTSEGRSGSVLTRFHYKYDDRYIIDLGLRTSGNSAIGKDVRWGLFPSVALAWRISSEDFAQREWLDDFKVRFSWGKSGNLPGGGAHSTYSASGGYYDMPVVKPDDIQLDKLTYETVSQFNAGLNLALKNYKYEFSLDVYDKKTDDMLFKDVALPGSTGFDKVKYMNMGGARNYGWEFTANARLYQDKAWSVRCRINLAQNFNEILSYPSNFGTNKFSLKNGEDSYARTLRLGDPIGAFYGFICDGVYSTEDETYATDKNGNVIQSLSGDPVQMMTTNYAYKAGDAKYRDINFDGVIDEYDVVYLGNGMPDLMGGIGPYVRYKSLSLNAFFSFNVGQEIVNLARMDTENMYGKDNQSTAVLSRWRIAGDQTDIPRALYKVGYNFMGSDRFVEDGSFMRLKTLTLNYKMEKKPWLKRFGVERINLFVSGYDLWTLTNYNGQDPEVSIGGSWTKLIGADRSKTPRSKRYTFGLNVKF
ncbi:TonB-dependent receptor [Puteibacter caeruleilacunae]|nr:TonB-dependent receptor [Puteibacter caeruleilacunae]